MPTLTCSVCSQKPSRDLQAFDTCFDDTTKENGKVGNVTSDEDRGVNISEQARVRDWKYGGNDRKFV